MSGRAIQSAGHAVFVTLAADGAAALMTPEERKAEFLDVSSVLWQQRQRLERFEGGLTLHCDQRALRSILTDLVWAVENCHVMGRHQVGEILHDQMGYDDVRPIRKRPQPP